MSRQYKDRTMQAAYDACVAAFHNPRSEFYFIRPDGTRVQRKGAGHRNAFWNGYNGLANRTFPHGSAAWAAYMAGRDLMQAEVLV